MKITNKTGPRISPCFTPMVQLIECLWFSISKLTLKLLWRDFKSRMTFIGTPNFSRTNQSRSLGTRSKALTKSRNRIHVSLLCSLLFFIAILTAKIASWQPLPGRNSHWASWSREFTTGWSRSWINIAIGFYKQLPVALFHDNCPVG